MTSLQLFLTYAVSWWMVLFMVLPHRAQPPLVPGLGHAASAPEHPRIRRKLLWTTAFAIIPTAILYVVIGYFNPALADDDMYHAGGKTGCAYGVYHAPADINAVDGTDASGKTLTPATIGGSKAAEDISVDLTINGDKYVKQPVPPAGSTTSPNSYLGLGKVTVKPDGSATLNGKPLTTTNDDCAHEGPKP